MSCKIYFNKVFGQWDSTPFYKKLKDKYEKLLYNGQENAVMKVNKGYNYGIYIRSRYHKPACYARVSTNHRKLFESQKAEN